MDIKSFSIRLSQTITYMVLFAPVVWVLAAHVSYNPAPPYGHDDEVMAIRDHAPHSPGAVLETHDAECWTGGEEALADLPGSAIVQYIGGYTERTRKPKIVDHAFNEALSAIGFGDPYDDPKIETIALCK
jgi:hypothetical protein